MHHLTLLTLTLLAVLGCFKKRISPTETARLVHCHNPWPTEDVLFFALMVLSRSL